MSGAPILVLQPKGFLLISQLWRSGELVFLVTWDHNNWYYPEKSSYPYLAP